MTGSFAWEYDTDEGESFDLFVEYNYIPYSPARLTADPYYSEPPEGGYCEDIGIKVTGYRQYDKNLNVTLDLETLTPEKSKELTDRFNKILDNSLRLQDLFQKLCNEDVERKMEYDDD